MNGDVKLILLTAAGVMLGIVALRAIERHRHHHNHHSKARQHAHNRGHSGQHGGNVVAMRHRR